jgi:hypothetical protein
LLWIVFVVRTLRSADMSLRRKFLYVLGSLLALVFLLYIAALHAVR